MDDARAAEAAIRTDPQTFSDLIGAPERLKTALRSGAAELEGDEAALRRLLREVGAP